MAVAAASSVLARRDGIDTGEALTAGLLHDLGSALVFRFDPRGWAMVERIAPPGSPDRLRAERDVFGMDHAEAGAQVLDAWRLPARIVDAVRAHHAAVAGPLGELLAAAESLAAAACPELHPADPAVVAVPARDLDLLGAVRDAADQLALCFSAA
jgi:putative nucleotidyltransferase with HDIG domain